MEGRFFESVRNLFKATGNKESGKSRRSNDGGDFMAVPGDQGLDTTDAEADIIAANKNE